MTKDRDLAPPVYQGDQDHFIKQAKARPLNKGSDTNRGRRARPGSGVVEGSGAGAGGGGNAEDYDSDAVAGGPAEE